MADNRFLLDTNAIIYLTTRGNIIPDDLAKTLEESTLFISVISEIELFSKPELPPDEEEGIHNFISERMSVIDINSAVKKETILFRRSMRRKLPDCIVAATAIILDAVLLTNDKKLLNLSWPGFRTHNIFS